MNLLSNWVKTNQGWLVTTNLTLFGVNLLAGLFKSMNGVVFGFPWERQVWEGILVAGICNNLLLLPYATTYRLVFWVIFLYHMSFVVLPIL